MLNISGTISFCLGAENGDGAFSVVVLLAGAVAGAVYALYMVAYVLVDASDASIFP